MSTYNLFSEDKKMLEQALSLLAQTYDQHGYNSPKTIFNVRDKIVKCSTVQLITNMGDKTFADEA